MVSENLNELTLLKQSFKEICLSLFEHLYIKLNITPGTNTCTRWCQTELNQFRFP